MVAPRVFVSSTCYDLEQIRNQIHPFLVRVGYDPVMSEYSDVLFDPRNHTHQNCVDAIKNVDMVIVIIGSRYGGAAVPQALQEIDWNSAELRSDPLEAAGANKKQFSITQLEVISAIENGTPIFTFAQDNVMREHLLYEKNKGKAILEEIEFPSIEKNSHAKYIFEFLNFLRHRSNNNAIEPFSKFQDIEEHLTKQWAALFQRLLHESLQTTRSKNRNDAVLEKIDNLQTALISTITDSKAKNVARHTIRFRRLIDFLLATASNSKRETISISNSEWNEFLGEIGVTDIRSIDNNRRYPTALILDDNSFFECRYSLKVIDTINGNWNDFKVLPTEERRLVVDAIAEQFEGPIFMLRRHKQSFEEYLAESNQEDDEDIPF